MPKYVLIRSWHVIRSATRVPGEYITRCGRRVLTVGALPPGGEIAATADELPLLDRSCETCLRLTRRDEDRGAV